MGTLKQIIQKYFSTLFYFFEYVRYRILLVFTISFIVGLMDGFGLAMFLPLLQMVGDPNSNTFPKENNLTFVKDVYDYFNLDLSLYSIFAFIIVFFILKGISIYFSVWYKNATQQIFIRKIRITLLDALNQVDYKFYLQMDIGRIQNTMTNEVEKTVQGFSSYFQTLQHAALVLVYALLAFSTDVKFSMLVVLAGITSNFMYSLIYKITKRLSRNITNENNKYQGLIIQHINNYKYLKSTGWIFEFGKMIQSTIFEIEKNRKKMGEINAVSFALREPLMITIIAVLVIVQVNYLGGNLASIIVSLLFFYRAMTALTNLQDTWNNFLSVSGSLYNVQSYQNELKENSQINNLPPIIGFNEHLSIKNATLELEGKKILKNINVKINKNEYVAIVGESGSGKSTLVNAITGLINFQHGNYFIDNQDVKYFNLDFFRRNIGYITQEPVIFNDTIYNNITLWTQSTQEARNQFHHCLKQAHLFDFVSSLELKENQILGLNGLNLSGGQKQRISIARELFKNPSLLILDEATSALDSETEKIIQQNLDLIKGQVTLLVIAHRLSTIKNADKIILLKNGSIEAMGTFQELLESNPTFKKMVDLQLLNS